MSRFPGDRASTLVAATLVCGGYFLGSQVGFAFTIQPSPVSTIWPPNAILLAALLLLPTRSWPALLLAALPAHLAIQLANDVPTTLVLLWFVSNCTEALLGAFFIRRLIGGGSLRFDDSRHVGFFVFGSIIGVFASTFLDVGFVTLVGWGEGSYWRIWRSRFFSNSLAALTLVPMIVGWTQVHLSHLRRASLRSVAEILGLAASLLGVNMLVFGWRDSGLGGIQAMLYAPLPFLVWAAMRFGSIGVSTATLVVALLETRGAIHRIGPFVEGSPNDSALSIQLCLILASIPLLLLSAVTQERRRAERTAVLNEERLKLALNAAQMTIWDWNLSAGDAAAQAGSSHTPFGAMLQEVHPDDKPAVAAAITEAIKTGTYWDVEFRVVQPDGNIGWVMGKGEVLSDESQNTRLLGVNVDITERKQAQHEAQEQRQLLTHLGRVAILGELSGALAHELSQPLTAILSNAQAARRLLRREAVDLREIDEILKDITAADRRAGDVIRRLRAMFKRGELNPQLLDLNQLTRDVLDLAHSDLVTRHVQVTTRFTPDLPKVRGDSVQVQQVLLNLIVNGCDAMIDNAPNDRQLVIETSRLDNDTVGISVLDNGGGIRADVLDQLFEPFVTTKRQGLGLGLTICRSIATAHGGQLWAGNNERRGSTFRLLLPRADSPAPVG